jgi:hypothetical protein
MRIPKKITNKPPSFRLRAYLMSSLLMEETNFDGKKSTK